MLRFKMIHTYISFAYDVYWVSRRETNLLINELNEILKANDRPLLSPHSIRRIKNYTVQSSLTNRWFSTLRGKKANMLERKLALYLGAITPLLDDLNDENGWSSEEIMRMIEGEKDLEHVLIQFLYSKLIAQCPEGFNEAFSTALRMQDASLKQLLSNRLSVEDLEEITKMKGGSWTFLYRMILADSPLPDEKEVIYLLGYLMQLTNDLFDVYKDLGQQQTFITNTGDINTIRAKYLGLIDQFKVQLYDLTYQKRNIDQTLLEISVILSRGLVSVDLLLNSQVNNGGRFLPQGFLREELICDMEQIGNIKKSIQFSAQIMKPIEKKHESNKN